MLNISNLTFEQICFFVALIMFIVIFGGVIGLFSNLTNIFSFFIRVWPIGLFFLLNILYFIYPILHKAPIINILSFTSFAVLCVALTLYKFHFSKTKSLLIALFLNIGITLYGGIKEFTTIKEAFSHGSFSGALDYLTHNNLYLMSFYLFSYGFVLYGFKSIWNELRTKDNVPINFTDLQRFKSLFNDEEDASWIKQDKNDSNISRLKNWLRSD